MNSKMFDMSLQNELLKKQNRELKEKLEAAEQRIDELEPLDEQNMDLRETNDRLTLRLQNIEEDFENVHEKLLDAEDQNKAILKIQEEAVENMEKLTASLEEAADLLISLEQEKAKMLEEIAKMKAQVKKSCHSEQFHDALDGQGPEKQPSRVYSIDESRPSTGNFDSDYYSQPASPQVKTRNSNGGLSFRDRANNLLDLSLKSKHSTQDLSKRVSAASLKTLQSREQSIASVAKAILEAHNTPDDTHSSKPIPRNPSRLNGPARMTPMAAVVSDDELEKIPSPTTPRTPVSNHGLRGYYRESRTTERPSYTSFCTHSTPSPARSLETALPSTGPRQSTARIPQTPSNERIKTPMREQFRPEAPPPEYPQSLPPPASVISDDLTSRPDPDRWWKGVGGVRSVVDQGQIQNGGTPQKAPMQTAASHLKNNPPLPLARPTERDVIFNASEDEEQFIKKVKGGFKGYLGRLK
jgi:myosin heavy subunit